MENRRLLDIARGNWGALDVVTNLASRKPALLDVLEEFNISAELVLCLYKCICKENWGELELTLMHLKKRPGGCPRGCEWE